MGMSGLGNSRIVVQADKKSAIAAVLSQRETRSMRIRGKTHVTKSSARNAAKGYRKALLAHALCPTGGAASNKATVIE